MTGFIIANLWAQGIVALGLIILTKFIWSVFFSPLQNFPGPLAAKLTNLWRVKQVFEGHIDQEYLQLHRKHGIAVRIGPNALSISDPNLIRVIYSTRNPWKKSDMYRPNDVFLNGQRFSNLFNTQDEQWHNQNILPIRNLWQMTKVLEYEPLIDETLAKFMNKLSTKFADSNEERVCPADEWITYFAWDVTANVSFGRHYGFIDQEKDVDHLITDSTDGLVYFASRKSRGQIVSWIKTLSSALAPYVTNRDSEVFGPDVDLFHPDRWLKFDEESRAEFQTRHRRMKDTCDFVFGGGGRICMGRYLALLEIKKLIATLYSYFDIQLADRSHEWTYRNAWFVYQSDMPMRVKHRKRQDQGS